MSKPITKKFKTAFFNNLPGVSKPSNQATSQQVNLELRAYPYKQEYILYTVCKRRVEEKGHRPAVNNFAAFNALDKMTAPRASRPPLLLSKHTKSYVIPIPQFPAFLAPKAGVPRKLAMEAKQHLAAGALGPLHSPAALIHDQNRAVAIGAVTAVPFQHRRLA